MILSRYKTYFILQAVFLIGILLYQSPWLFSKTTTGTIVSFGTAASSGNFRVVEMMRVSYEVEYESYIGYYTRNATPKSTSTVKIRYLTFSPGTSRLSTSIGEWGEPLLYYLIFFIGTSMFFLIPNESISKEMTIVLRKKRPWVKIDKRSD
jgi:hypothetical protein